MLIYFPYTTAKKNHVLIQSNSFVPPNGLQCQRAKTKTPPQVTNSRAFRRDLLPSEGGGRTQAKQRRLPTYLDETFRSFFTCYHSSPKKSVVTGGHHVRYHADGVTKDGQTDIFGPARPLWGTKQVRSMSTRKGSRLLAIKMQGTNRTTEGENSVLYSWARFWVTMIK